MGEAWEPGKKAVLVGNWGALCRQIPSRSHHRADIYLLIYGFNITVFLDVMLHRSRENTDPIIIIIIIIISTHTSESTDVNVQ